MTGAKTIILISFLVMIIFCYPILKRMCPAWMIITARRGSFHKLAASLQQLCFCSSAINVLRASAPNTLPNNNNEEKLCGPTSPCSFDANFAFYQRHFEVRNVVEFCDGMVAVLSPSFALRRKHVAVARILSELGRRAAHDLQLKEGLLRYFQARSAFLDAWYEAAFVFMPEFYEQGLANVLCAHAQLGLRPRREFLREWYKHAAWHMPNFTAQGLSNILYAHGRLDLLPADEFLQFLFKAVKLKIDHFNEQGLGNLWYAFGKLRIVPPDDLLCELYRVCRQRMSEFNAQGLSNVFYAMALLNLKPPDPFVQLWSFAAVTHLRDFSTQQLANSFYAHALLALDPLPAFLRSCYARMENRVFQFKPQELANMLYGHALLNCCPPASVLDAWLAAAEAKLSEFNSQEISNVLLAFAQLDMCVPVDLLSALFYTLKRNIAFFSMPEVASCLYSLALFAVCGRNRIQTDLVPLCAEVLCKNVDILTAIELRSVYNAMQYFRLPLNGTEESMSAMKRYFATQPIGAISDFHADVVNSLKETLIGEGLAGCCAVEVEHWIDAIATRVDILITSGNCKPFVLQVDGPRHFVRPNGCLRPKDQLQNILLQRSNYVLYRLSFSEWNQHKSVEAKRTFLRQVLAPVLSLPQTAAILEC